ncbi:hypothetical protein Rhopal_006399-T1 [Rhodotorula paludigena]|uniref:Uncharacterized protein n=1 Tax=Rhodotorula paludigena TaxID=86838 RepID=A0AAV5GL94_9BASI|nr:hypothetical protein Rhopal_006399-T1 [Rhodotorula paludigena]
MSSTSQSDTPGAALGTDSTPQRDLIDYNVDTEIEDASKAAGEGQALNLGYPPYAPLTPAQAPAAKSPASVYMALSRAKKILEVKLNDRGQLAIKYIAGVKKADGSDSYTWVDIDYQPGVEGLVRSIDALPVVQRFFKNNERFPDGGTVEAIASKTLAAIVLDEAAKAREKKKKKEAAAKWKAREDRSLKRQANIEAHQLYKERLQDMKHQQKLQDRLGKFRRYANELRESGFPEKSAREMAYKEFWKTEEPVNQPSLI